MIGFYGLAKIFEAFDYRAAALIPTGGHPWKHVAGAVAMLCYVQAVRRRSPLKDSISMGIEPQQIAG